MSLSLLLLWFPIVLAAGAGGRLLGGDRGLAFGIVCALFWLLLLQVTGGVGLWGDPWTVSSVIAGIGAIALVGAWSGQTAANSDFAVHGRAAADPSAGDGARSKGRPELGSIGAALGRFDDWLEETAGSKDPWADLGEYLRGVLREVCGATHVRPYRVVCEGTRLEPLCAAGVLANKDRLSASEGVLGRVLASGISCVAGDRDGCASGAVPEAGAALEPVWCFPIARGRERVGVVSVGRVDGWLVGNRRARCAVEQTVGHLWSVFTDKLSDRAVQSRDKISMLATRDVFMREANLALRESYKLGEPVAVAVVAVQGLRSLTDTGRWEVADDVVRTIADALRRRIRLDDCVGRLDEARVVWLVRRVDVALAQLVVAQVASHVVDATGKCQASPVHIVVNWGVATSGNDQPPLRRLVIRALEAAGRARRDRQTVRFAEVGEARCETAGAGGIS